MATEYTIETPKEAKRPSDCSAIPDRYRKHDFYDMKRGFPLYGVDARVRPGKWMHLAEKGKPVLFDAPEDRDAKLKELRKSLKQKTTLGKSNEY